MLHANDRAVFQRHRLRRGRSVELDGPSDGLERSDSNRASPRCAAAGCVGASASRNRSVPRQNGKPPSCFSPAALAGRNRTSPHKSAGSEGLARNVAASPSNGSGLATGSSVFSAGSAFALGVGERRPQIRSRSVPRRRNNKNGSRSNSSPSR